MPLISRLLTVIFRYLYHDFAFAYDAVAAVVSFGQWCEWISTTLPFIQGSSILEIGHGPGHLQQMLNNRETSNLSVYGLDESDQMGHLAHRRLVHSGTASPQLTRGLAEELPYRENSFDTVVSTFPAEYIFAQSTLSEVHRVLRNKGRFVVLPAATPKSIPLKWLYRITNQSHAENALGLKEELINRFLMAGFSSHVERIVTKSSTLQIILAIKE